MTAGTNHDAASAAALAAQRQKMAQAAASRRAAQAAAAANAAQETMIPVNPVQQSVLLVTAGYDHTIRFWDALSGSCSRTLQHAESQVNALAITPDKRFVAAAGNPHVRLYDASGGTPVTASGQNTSSAAGQPIHVFEGHSGNVTSVGFQRDMRWMYTSSDDGTIKLWDIRTPRCQRDYDHKAAVNQVALHPNQGELISCDQNGSLKLWDLAGNVCTHELVPEEDVPVRSVSIANDGSLLVACNNQGHVFVWRMVNGKDATDLQPVTKIQAHNTYITKCLLSPDVQKLATISADKTVKLWSTRDFMPERTLTGHQRWVWDCAFSADSAYLITASSDQVARLWDLSSGETIRMYQGHGKALTSVALHDVSFV